MGKASDYQDALRSLRNVGIEARHLTCALISLLVPVVVLGVLTTGRALGGEISITLGQPKLEKVEGLQLHGFGRPEQKGGRWCRNTDETGVGDNRAGYASIEIRAEVREGLYEFRMWVWGQSDQFSFVAHNGTKYRTIEWGRPSGRPRWEVIRFVLRPTDLDQKGKVQRFGFGSRDRQVWVSRLSFRPLGLSSADREALRQARRAAPGALILAASGATDYRIVLPNESDPVMRYAASELQKYLLLMSDTYLRVQSQKELSSGRRCIVLSSFSKRRGKPGSPDSFTIATADDRITIVGASPLGTLFGVYAFLERLGCRWIMPGPDGEVVPRHDPLVVPKVNVREAPDFKIRWIGSGDWALKNRCNVNSKVNGVRVGYVWKWSYHSFYGLLPPKTYWDAHPEYYSLIGDQRRRPAGYSGRQICTENREARILVAANIIKLFREDPRVDIVALCPNDGGGFCTCPRCRALDRPNPDFWGRYSDRLAPFNNEVCRVVGRACPDKLVKTGAYAMYMRYPVLPGYVPEPNMAVQACHTYSCNNHPIDSDCKRNRLYFREPLEKWARHAKHVWIYEYYIKGAWAGLLYTQTHVMRRDIPYYRRIGAEGFYTQWSAGSFHTVGLNYYVAARLLWDTHADVDAIIRDYCTAFYGEAGDAMFAFYKALERAFIESGDCISPFGYKRVWIAAQQVFTPGALAELEHHLRNAEKLARSDVVKRRIEPLRVTFEYTKRAVNYLRAVAKCFDGIESPQSPGFAEAEARARELGERLSADIVRYLKAHGRGGYVSNPRSKSAALLRVHRNPRVVVPRWWRGLATEPAAQARALPPIPGNRLVGRVADHARVRLDKSNRGVKEKWFAVDFDDSEWPVKPFPCYWQDAGLAQEGYVGYGWYRVQVEVPPNAAPKGTRLMLRFEGVDAAATVYINSRLAGKHKYVPGRSWQTPFELDVTDKLKPGRNLLAVRVYTGGGKGGVYGRVVLYRLGDQPEDFMRP